MMLRGIVMPHGFRAIKRREHEYRLSGREIQAIQWFRARADQFSEMGLWESTPVADFVAVLGQSATGVASCSEKRHGSGLGNKLGGTP